MSFNPDLQYRCTIIRGKSISKMDDYLPIYAEILNEICPLSSTEFKNAFDKKLSHYLKIGKTQSNHRTENAGQLLGMYFEKDGIVYMSERTKKFLNDNDQPAFFKSVCYKFQQPNGSQTLDTIKDKIKHEVNFKPYHFVLALLKMASDKHIILTKNEVGYYVLNSLQVLQGKISIEEVFNKIQKDRLNGLQKKVVITKNAAWDHQHINEQFDYLFLANLIRRNRVNIWLNPGEQIAVDYFLKDLLKAPTIDYNKYDLDRKKVGKEIEKEWQTYYGELSNIEKTFITSIESLETSSPTEEFKKPSTFSTIELGDEGEDYVLQVEKDIVRLFNPRLVNKINHHGKTKGLGYDITSIEANRDMDNPEYFRYIEVKATKRVHPPDFSNTFDTINLTRNEWVAAEQHSHHFYIYRIYFTTQGTYINIIKDPVSKSKSEKRSLYATPVMYRIEFNDRAVDERLDF